VPHPHLAGWLVLCGAILFLLGLGYLLPYLSPFLFAMLLAALIDAPVNHLEKKGLPRPYAILVIIGLLLFLIIGAASLLAVNLLSDLMGLTAQLPILATWVQEFISELISHMLTFTSGFPLPLADTLLSLAQQMTKGLETLLYNSLATLIALPSMFTNFMVGILATYFMVRDGRTLARQTLAILPLAWQKKTARIKRELFAGLVGFVRAEVLLMTISGILTTIALMLFQVPYAWLLGAAASVLDLLPIVGVGGIFLPLVIGYWGTGRTVLAAGLVAAWGVVALVRQVCEPVLMSAKIGLHPLTSLVTIYLGMQVWGIGGAFLAPVVAISMKVLWLGALRPFLLDS
jgi:sporulation integral membrane protein YtvI